MALVSRFKELNRTYTCAEFEQLPEFEEPVELIEGKLVEKVNDDEHLLIVSNLSFYISSFDQQRRQGRAWVDSAFKLSEYNVALPGLAYITNERLPKGVSKSALTVIPDLVLEVLSTTETSTREGTIAACARIRRYQVAGVRLIWLVDPVSKAIEVFQPNSLEPVASLTEKDMLEGHDVIPGFTLKVKKLFEE
ncbi:MAG: Uma2 family endonuclease [Chloroflexi bacterium]|uniref:Uma2 family endonuclease n=1 Tax=Candidatus Chlorohelix allophototropha TaxID=3003348 RepID=A0A8T7M5S2_9CHLR|nr:Uma2 family endonuclease [Chloroflexota bacterium]WJW69360.1 Uma2 family endonuclease [Chloroflexota bacterium L227-S17]